MLAGDFNSPPPLVRGQVGHRADKFRSPSVADLHCLENLIQDHSLILLNSWTRSAAATFRSEQSRTLIDHVYVRRDQADVVARQSCPPDWSLATWRGGGKHWAVTASLPFPSCRALQTAKSTRPLIDLECLRKVCRDPTHPAVLRLREAASSWVRSHPYGSITQLNTCLLDQVRALFPARRQQGRVVPWTQPQVTLSVKAMWEAYHQWRYRARHGRRGLFDAWRYYSSFRRAHQAFRRQSRQAKKQWFQAKVLEMEKASAAGDIRTLFRLTGTLLPKQPKRRLQLRGPQGEVWTPKQELASLRSFYQDLYAPSDEPRLHSDSAPMLQLSPEEAQLRLASLPVGKAVPPQFAPTAAFRACSDVLAGWLSEKIQHLPDVPEEWAECWLALLPKVTCPTLPKQLRPIGLTEPTGRVYAGALQDRLRPYVMTYIGEWPQLAYVPNRSTRDALRRVFRHCDSVHSSQKRRRYDIQQARWHSVSASSGPSAKIGGIQASFDLTQAFDRLGWTLVQEALIDAQVPVELRGQLLDFYRHLGYHLRFGDEHAVVRASRGVKQGCKVAPLLWSLTTGLPMRRLARRTSKAWLLQALTAFADDLHLGQEVRNLEMLTSAVLRVGHLIEVLEEARMIINTDKSVILISLPFSFDTKWRRRHLCRVGDTVRLQLRTPSGRGYKLPVVSQHKYLGAIITYEGACAEHTVAHRLQQTWAAWSRLRPALTSASAPALPIRLRLWKACIPPIALYALDCLPLHRRLLTQVQHALTRQLWAVARSQAHLTHESTADLHHRLGVPPVQHALLRAADKQLDRMQHLPAEARFLDCTAWQQRVRRYLQDSSDACAAPTRSDPTDSRMGGASSVYSPSCPVSPDEWRCPHCSYCAISFRILRVHLSRVHHDRASGRSDNQRFRRELHSTGGMPTCRLCHRAFPRWSGLRLHINAGQCPNLPLHTAQASVSESCNAISGHHSASSPRPLPPAELVEDTPACSSSLCRPQIRALVGAPADPAVDQSPVVDFTPAPNLGSCPGEAISAASQPQPCSVPVSAEVPIPPVMPPAPQVDLPLTQCSAFCAELTTRGWQHFLLRTDLRPRLQHFCPLCGQWAATPSGLKVHMHQAHAEWQNLLPHALAKAQVLRRSVKKPCTYCGLEKFDKQHHWKQCSVIVMLAFLDTLLGATSVPKPLSKLPDGNCNGQSGVAAVHELHDAHLGGAGRLPHDQATSQCHRRGGRGAFLYLNGGYPGPGCTHGLPDVSVTLEPAERSAGQRQGQRQRQGQGQTPESRSFRLPCQMGAGTLRGWLAPKSCDTACPSRVEPSDSSDGYPSSLLYEGRGSVVPPESLRDRHRMEPAPSGGSHQDYEPTPGSPDEGCLAGDGHQSQADLGEGAVPQECHGAQVDRGRLVVVHEVESTTTDPRVGRSDEASPALGAASNIAGTFSPDRSGLCEAVCVHPDASREPHNGVGALRARARTPRGWWNHVAPATAAHQQFGAPSFRSQIASRPTGSFGPSVSDTRGNLVDEPVLVAESDVGLGLSTPTVVPSSLPVHYVLRLALSNPSGTACYMNAALLALLWSIPFSTPGAPAHYGGLTGMHQLAQARSSFDLHKQMGWKFLIGQWAQPFQQHDVHEFLLYLLPRLRLRCLYGFWAMRRLDAAGVTTCDSSSTDVPITIDLPDDARGLQHCIQEWHSQHYRAALTSAPPMLILQLRRFRYDSCGQVFKDFQALDDMGETVRIPLFTSSGDLAVQWKPYQVCAALLHTGEAASRGHYRSILRNGENIWHITDDDMCATLQPSACLHRASASVYVLICTEVSE